MQLNQSTYNLVFFIANYTRLNIQNVTKRYVDKGINLDPCEMYEYQSFVLNARFVVSMAYNECTNNIYSVFQIN